jgi:hypothetical protein
MGRRDGAPHLGLAGRLGGRLMAAPKRWGPSRILRLDELDPVTREIVMAILNARANAAKAAKGAD